MARADIPIEDQWFDAFERGGLRRIVVGGPKIETRKDHPHRANPMLCTGVGYPYLHAKAKGIKHDFYIPAWRFKALPARSSSSR